MTHHQRLREQLDAYRDEGDLARAEMQPLAEAVSNDPSVAAELARGQRLDRAIAAGLADLPVPEGLEERLLAGVRQAQEAAAVNISAATSKRPWKMRVGQALASRKTWFAGATAAALLLSALAGTWYWRHAQHIIEQEQIASAVGGWQKAADSNRSARSLPGKFVLPLDLVKPVRYVPFRTEEGWSAVAVDCTTTNGAPAKLYIVESSANFRVGASTITRLAGSPGKKVAAWKRGRLLYVLVEEVAKPRAGAAIYDFSAPPA